jgi:hypothetical protein
MTFATLLKNKAAKKQELLKNYNLKNVKKSL